MISGEVEITRVLHAPIEKVWNAWIDPESLKQWKAPEGMTTTDASTDARVGGSYAVSMRGGHAGDMTLRVRGVYKTVRYLERLEFSWRWDGQEEETTVTIFFRALSNDRTELKLIHRGFVTHESLGEHRSGWSSTLNKLGKYTEGG